MPDFSIQEIVPGVNVALDGLCNRGIIDRGGSVLEQLGAEHVIPGHSPIQTPAALADLRRWFITLRAQVGEALASGWDRKTTVTQVAQRMQELAPRGSEERLSTGIGQIFDELSRDGK